MDIKKIALFAAGTLFGSAGFKLLSSKDAISHLTNWKDRSTCVLFGDGAGAVVL